MAKITIKLFANLKEEIGQDEIQVECENGDCIDDALRTAMSKTPSLKELLMDESGYFSHLNFTLNGEQADLSDDLNSGDEIAVFPPVSGG